MRSLLLLLCLATSTIAAPTILNHQGRIAVAGVNYDGNGFFKFALIDGTATQTFWSNDGTTTGEPTTAKTIAVNKGHYATLLGSSNPIPPATFAANDDIRLRVWFSNDNSTFTQLTPDRRLTPAGYAFSAATAASLIPSYETGAGPELLLSNISGSGILSFNTNYTQNFATPPGVTLENGWSLTNNNTSGFAAEASFIPQTIDNRSVTGSHTSLAIIAGRPAIAYRSDSEGDLLFVRSNDTSGSAWPATSTIVRVAGAGISDVGEFASLADVVGRPAIAYYDATSGNLNYVRADDASGTSWPTPIIIDGASSNTGRHCSLAMIAGKPAITYTSPNTGELVYAEALDAEGTSWQTSTIEGAINDYRQFSSLAEVGGEPAVATYDLTTGTLRYLYRTTSTWTGINIDPAGGLEPHLATVNGRPAIAYRTSTTELKFAHATDTAGTIWPTPNTLAPAGRQPSLTEIANLPAIAFYNPNTGDLDLSWNGSTATIDGSTTNVGTHCSLTLVAGLPTIAYHDESNSTLKFAALPNALWSASTGAAQPILASGVKTGAITEAMLSEELATSLAAKDSEIASLKARIEALERAVFGSSN